MMVVPVLITSCQVSLKAKSGPVTTQTTMMATARVNTRGRPQKCAAALANREYQVERGMIISKHLHGISARLQALSLTIVRSNH